VLKTTVTLDGCATGTTGAAPTVMLIKPVELPPALVTVNMNESAPEYPFAGV